MMAPSSGVQTAAPGIPSQPQSIPAPPAGSLPGAAHSLIAQRPSHVPGQTVLLPGALMRPPIGGSLAPTLPYPASAAFPLIPEPVDQVAVPSLDVFKLGVLAGRHQLIGAKATWTLGRDKDQVDIVMNHESISRKHAEVSRQGMFMFLTDLGSAHGTSVDGQKLAKSSPVRLNRGANIRFGASTRIYMFREPPLQYDAGGRLQVAPRPLAQGLPPPEPDSPTDVAATALPAVTLPRKPRPSSSSTSRSSSPSRRGRKGSRGDPRAKKRPASSSSTDSRQRRRKHRSSRSGSSASRSKSAKRRKTTLSSSSSSDDDAQQGGRGTGEAAAGDSVAEARKAAALAVAAAAAAASRRAS